MVWYDYLVILLAFGFVALIVFFHFRSKRKPSKSSCSGKCESCKMACNCYKIAQAIKEYKKISK